MKALALEKTSDIVPDADPYTSPYAKMGPGREDWLNTTLELGYSVTEAIYLGLGLTAFHPAKDASTEYFILPLFGTVGSLSADNYAAWYFDISYTL